MMLPENHIIQDMYEAAAATRHAGRKYLGMSQIGERCSRKLWYQFRGYSPRPLEGRAAMIFDLGNRVEDAVLHWLTSARYCVNETQREFSAHNNLFRGHCDGIINGVTQRPHILEIKSANDRRFKAFQRDGIRAVAPVYYCQVQCYMGYSGLERALFIVMNKNTSEIYTERVRFSREDFEALHQRAYAILTANEEPPRLSDALNQPEPQDCQWCDFRTTCINPEQSIQSNLSCGCCAGFFMDGLTPCCLCQDNTQVIDWDVNPATECKFWYYRENSDVPF